MFREEKGCFKSVLKTTKESQNNPHKERKRKNATTFGRILSVQDIQNPAEKRQVNPFRALSFRDLLWFRPKRRERII